MEAMRNDWTDDRLDHFRAETKQRFDVVDSRFDRVEAEMDRRFDEVDKRLDKVETAIKEQGKELHGSLHAFQRTMIQFSGVFIAGLFGLIATQI